MSRYLFNEKHSYFQRNLHTKKDAKPSGSDNDIHQIQLAIDRHWESQPKEAKTFLLNSLDSLNFYTLTKFWSSPKTIEYTRGSWAGGACGASLFIALSYMKLGKLKEATAMTLNGSFLLQCIASPIEHLISLCGPDFQSPIKENQVPFFGKGFLASRSPQMMKQYLEEKLPGEYQHMMESFAKTQSGHVMNYVDEIGDDWDGMSKRKHQRSVSKTSNAIQIELILADDTNKNVRHALSIGSSTTLKTLFNDYAEKRGVSLRSLRFSHNGKTLFLSLVGNKTPEECNMLDQDVILVHNTSVPEESSDSVLSKSNISPTQKALTSRKSKKKPKGKRNKKRQNIKQEKNKAIEDYKAQHSIVLTKVHDEVQPRLKEIRMRLNALDIKRQPPKQKKKEKKKITRKENVDRLNILPSSGIGAKAGRSYFVVQVGEVQNLYKSTRSSKRSPCSESSTGTLDLHGCTVEEALDKLDESLSLWVETAMKGSYPFVMQAKIICGCGNQILSDAVEKWVRENKQVANAPKNMVMPAICISNK